MKLFRDNALAHRRTGLHGPVRLAPSPVGLWLTVALAIMAVAAIGFAATTQYARKVLAPGVLRPEAGLMHVAPLADGVVEAVLVQEGQTVGAGQPLVRVASPLRSADGRNPLAERLVSLDRAIAETDRRIALAASTEAIARQRASVREAALAAQRDAINAHIAQQREIVALVRAEAARAEALAERGVATRANREVTLRAVAEAQRGVTALQQERAEIEGAMRETPVDAEAAALAAAERRAALAAERTALERERLALSAQAGALLVAPVEGTVAAVLTTPGEAVQADRAVVHVLPASAALVADIYVPSRAIGFVGLGQTARLRYDAFPFERFGLFEGRITSVTRTVLDPANQPSGLATGAPVYRVTAALARQSVPVGDHSASLQPGMTLQAAIQLERRSLLRWLFSPLAAMRAALS